MMIPTILITSLCLVAGIQSETGVCQREDYQNIQMCIREDDSEIGTCARLENAIRCIKSTNEDCATNALFVGEFTLDYGPSEVSSNESCFHQRFDEYFNQDGLCSFQDVKE